MAPRAGDRTPDPDAVADAVLAASRALVKLSLQSLDSLNPVISASELRVLALLARKGAQRLMDIAASLAVTSTTATRLADRLTEHGLVERVRLSSDRREVHVSISASGRTLVMSVQQHRRNFVASVLEDFSSRDQVVTLRLLSQLSPPAVWVKEDSA